MPPFPGRDFGSGTLDGRHAGGRGTIGFAVLRANRFFSLSVDVSDWPLRFTAFKLEFLVTPLVGNGQVSMQKFRKDEGYIYLGMEGVVVPLLFCVFAKGLGLDEFRDKPTSRLYTQGVPTLSGYT